MEIGTTLFILFLYHILFNYDAKMSMVKDINDLPLPVKAIIISVAGFMPFWFVILYYFFPNILSIGWYEKLMFLFVPTIIWYVLEYISVSQGISFLSRATKNSPVDKNKDIGFWIIVAIDGFIYLAILTIIAYYFNFSFENFLWIAFLFRIVTAIYATMLNFVKT